MVFLYLYHSPPLFFRARFNPFHIPQNKTNASQLLLLFQSRRLSSTAAQLRFHIRQRRIFHLRLAADFTTPWRDFTGGAQPPLSLRRKAQKQGAAPSPGQPHAQPLLAAAATTIIAAVAR